MILREYLCAVENLNRLLRAYSNDDRVKGIQLLLSQKLKHSVLLMDSSGAQECFVLTALYMLGVKNHLFVAYDKEEASFLHNTLDNINPDPACSFFPDSFKRPLRFEELDPHNILQRTEAINQFSSERTDGFVLISYPEALFEKVVDPKILNKQRIDIHVGESVDMDTIFELLIEYGFERVDFVYEPGQFSLRGGIIDVFSFGNEWPYRLELFDEEVESIRSFDPGTQLSVRNIRKISIIPNVTGKFSDSDKLSVLDILPDNTVVWLRDPNHLIDKTQECFDKAQEFSTSLAVFENEDLKEIFRERSFIYPHEILEKLSKLSKIYLTKPLSLISSAEVSLSGKPQTSFNRSFQLLIDELTANESRHITNYLFTDNTKQIERFYSIFEDLSAKIQFHPIPKAIHLGFRDEHLKIACYTDHQIFERYHRYKVKRGYSREQALSLQLIRDLQPGDYVVHIDHGIGKYSGLEKLDINGHIQESVRLFYRNNDVLYVGIQSLHKISKYIGKDGTAPKLDKIGSDAWKILKKRTKKKVKDIARELIQLYAKRKTSPGFACQPDGYLQNELEASFLYEDTPDQFQATVDTKADMERDYPMDRLICGDVGFGKTEIAVRAAFKAAVNGRQTAILVPTTILAIQHYKTFSERLGDFPVKVDYINRFRSSAEKSKIFEELKKGEIDIVIGTHALLNKKIEFSNLGLLVIDEEQKFGVAAKEKLRKLAINVDTLTLTATPIPRTLQFSLLNARDLSVIRTPPPNRQPIHTERRVFNDELIREAIYYEVHRGGQIFFVHNRVKSLDEVLVMICKLCPDVSVAMAHGQMDPKILEQTLVDFIEGKYDVLVCTNIIETGLDIPNANTMLINNAHQFGLSDLHQLRGRVGRSNKKAFCYLLAPPVSVLTAEARKRLKTLEEFSELGSGFHIAMQDLDIRGAGNLLGAEQSGFIADIGYETYQRILEEAVLELKEDDFKEEFREELISSHSFVRDVDIDTDIEMLIPDQYVNNIQERLKIYSQIDQIQSEEDISTFKEALKDRFGPLPDQVEELFNGVKLRWISKKLGFEKLVLKERKLKCFFITNQQSGFYETEIFNRILSFVSTQGSLHGLSMKQTRSVLMLIKEGVSNLKESRAILEGIYNHILDLGLGHESNQEYSSQDAEYPSE